MSTPYVAAADAHVVKAFKPKKKKQANQKGRATKMASADDMPVSDAAAMQTVVVTMSEEDAKTGSEGRLLEKPETILESINILV